MQFDLICVKGCQASQKRNNRIENKFNEGITILYNFFNTGFDENASTEKCCMSANRGYYTLGITVVDEVHHKNYYHNGVLLQERPVQEINDRYTRRKKSLTEDRFYTKRLVVAQKNRNLENSYISCMVLYHTKRDEVNQRSANM